MKILINMTKDDGNNCRCMANRRTNLRTVRWAIRRSARIVPREDMELAVAYSHIRNLHLVLLDKKYRVASADAVKLYLEWSKIDKLRYISEYFDCEDFACSLRAEARLKIKLNSVGEIDDLSGGHAYVAIVVHDGENTPLRIIVIEPQSDHEIRNRAGLYQADAGYAIF